MGSIDQSHPAARKIAIIGAGPSGLAAAKYLVAEQAFDEIVIFEQRDNVGGLWNYTAFDRIASQPINVPHTDPFVDNERSFYNEHGKFMSPVYDKLETNIPRGLMGFSDLDWPETSQLFPQHEIVLSYIESYAKDVKHLIRLNTQVTEVKHIAQAQWHMRTHNVESQTEEHYQFDAVIVANGHFNVPYIPPVDGIKAWQETYPGTIIHSQAYRTPNDFVDQKVVVVGNSASGVDIGAQIRKSCRKPMIQSSTSESFLSPDPSSDQVERSKIVRYDITNRTIHFADGQQESNVDAVVYCTGYMYSFPFLNDLRPPLISTGERVQNLYKHIFWQYDPTLTFMVLIQKGIPFPVAEVQAAVISRVLSGRLSLPTPDVMLRWEQQTLQNVSRVRDFHLIKFPKDYDYINELHDWAVSADVLHVNGHIRGKRPPRWSDEDYWTREKFPEIKKTFQRLGEARHDARTLRDVGFEFQSVKT